MTQEITYLPFKQLEISPFNARTVDPGKESDKELLASIRARGVLQNLIVHPTGKKGRYGVCAGGRRFAALTLLHSEGELDGDALVPCRIAQTEQQARDWSVAENRGREAMHPADEFMAFQALAKDGKSVADIAREFGVNQSYVKRLLKLASVAPKLVGEFRAGKLDLDEMQAFAVSEDHEKQLAIYDQLSCHGRSPYRIRQLLIGEAYRSDDRLTKFVGVAAYKRAGGAVSTDLFQSVSYLSDGELLEGLAKAKLEQTAKEYMGQGWKWVQVDVERSQLSYGEFAGYLQPSPDSAPVELREQLAAKEAELRMLEEQDELSDEDEARCQALDGELEALQYEVEEKSVYLDSDKAASGVLLLVNHSGDPEPHCGLMTREDAAERRRSNSNKAGEESNLDDAREGEPRIESQALATDLRNFRLQAMQAELLRNSALAYDMLVFTLVEAVIEESAPWANPLHLSGRPESLDQTGGIQESLAAAKLQEHRQKLDAGWAQHEDKEERLRAFVALPKKAKQELMTHAVALLLRPSLDGVLVELMGFNLLDYWQPNADNYFSRIRTGDLLEIGRDQLGETWASEHSKLKKGQLVQALHEAEGMAGWLPKSLS